MKLRDIAHTRTGDKGNISNVAVVAYDKRDYPLLKEFLTAAVVSEFFSEIVKGVVIRKEVPSVGALNFIMYEALGGGVTRTLALDAHGKSLGSALLELELDNTNMKH